MDDQLLLPVRTRAAFSSAISLSESRGTLMALVGGGMGCVMRVPCCNTAARQRAAFSGSKNCRWRCRGVGGDHRQQPLPPPSSPQHRRHCRARSRFSASSRTGTAGVRLVELRASGCVGISASASELRRFWRVISEPGWTSQIKVLPGLWLKSTRRSHIRGFFKTNASQG